MHEALISSAEVDDFFILRSRAFAAGFQRAMVRDVLNDHKLPLIEWQLLFSVARFGTCHLAHITQNTPMDPAHGSRAATKMEAKGLVERHDDPENRRRKLISLTPEGITLLNELWPKAQAMMNKVAEGLDGQDLSEIKRILDVLNVGMEKIESSRKREGQAKDYAAQTNR